MSNTTIRKSIFIAASCEEVWLYLTDKSKLGDWFHPALNDLEQGKPYTLLEDASDAESRICWGEVLSADKPAALSYTFTVKPLNGAMTTVHWKLEPAAGGTRLSLTHEGVEAAAGEAALGLLMALDKGWDEHFSKLRGSIAA